MTELDPKLTFDAFVVGPANRLASAAARRAAESPGASYNPLFLYSASGLGKSHLLHAIAQGARRSDQDLAVEYQALESYLEELADALESGARDTLRDRYKGLDILLMDDVQFLAGQPEAQEMLLTTLDTLTAAGSQIVLASDRPPAEINGLDARLVSRFSGGLIVDIGAPEYETRVAIIRKKSEKRGHTLQPGVAEALARYPFKNVRELGGALNRILAVQDLEERPVSPEEIPGLMGEDVAPSAEGEDDFGSFLSEVSDTLADTVEAQEEAWRKALREAAEAAERGGFKADRLRALLDHQSEPAGWETEVERFRADVGRLQEIDEELDELDNPWPEAAQGVLHDPDHLEEAEALLASVRERTRPFRVLGPGPDLAALAGKAPQLALKACEQLVEAEKPQYNPLFFWSEDPTGPRALLGAAGRSYAALNPESHTAVVSVSDFAEDFIRALSAGVAGAWRERWWTVDLLLVHDTQALSETERAQDEFFHLFEALKRRGARVMIVADRPPSGIGGIDDRLRSRFEGGLVLEVSGVEAPPGAADLTLHEPGAPGAAAAPEPAPATEPAAPAPQPAAPAGGEAAGPSTPAVGETAEGGGRGWVPTREKVVWFWPQMQDRLVEDLE